MASSGAMSALVSSAIWVSGTQEVLTVGLPRDLGLKFSLLRAVQFICLTVTMISAARGPGR